MPKPHPCTPRLPGHALASVGKRPRQPPQPSRERLRRDGKSARDVQISFLPTLPQLPGYEFYAYYQPAHEVGGDYYDFIPLPPEPQRLAIVLGDVAGKGVPAALLMAKLSSDARFCLLSRGDAAAAITMLNDLTYPHTHRVDRFVTLAAAVLDPVRHTLTLVNAGHPAPLLCRRDTGNIEELTSKDTVGLPLGVIPGCAYQPHRVHLHAGDCVVLYSDGVTDQVDRQANQSRQEAIRRALQEGIHAPHVLGKRVLEILAEHASGREQHDDITLICFGRSR